MPKIFYVRSFPDMSSIPGTANRPNIKDLEAADRPNIREETKGRFCRRVVLANVPLPPFSG